MRVDVTALQLCLAVLDGYMWGVPVSCAKCSPPAPLFAVSFLNLGLEGTCGCDTHQWRRRSARYLKMMMDQTPLLEAYGKPMFREEPRRSEFSDTVVDVVNLNQQFVHSLARTLNTAKR